MFGNPMEIALIVGAAVLLFGADKLPKLARSAGQAKKEFMVGQAEADVAAEQGARGSAAARRSQRGGRQDGRPRRGERSARGPGPQRAAGLDPDDRAAFGLADLRAA